MSTKLPIPAPGSSGYKVRVLNPPRPNPADLPPPPPKKVCPHCGKAL